MSSPHQLIGPSAPFHIRLGSSRAAEFPTVVRRVIRTLPDGASALLDLCDIGTIDPFSARVVRESVVAAARRDVRVVVAANDDEVERALRRERLDDMAALARDMSDARRVLGLLDSVGPPVS